MGQEQKAYLLNQSQNTNYIIEAFLEAIQKPTDFWGYKPRISSKKAHPLRMQTQPLPIPLNCLFCQ